MSRVYLILLLILGGASKSIAGPIFLVEGQVLDVDVAQEGLTRFEIVGDGIEDVFIHPSSAKPHFHLHPKGHLFFTGKDLQGSVSVTLMTPEGEAQDLRLHLKSQKAAPILLQRKSQEEAAYTAPKSPLKAWMKTALMGGIPEGFKALAPQREERKGVGLLAKSQLMWGNGSYELTQFHVEGEAGRVLDAESLKQKGDVALLFSDQKMSSDGTTFYVLRTVSMPQKLHHTLKKRSPK